MLPSTKKNIQAIAKACARHCSHELVLRQDADDAVATLNRLGLNRRPIVERPEFYVGIGVTLIGVAMQMPDAFSGLLPPFARKDDLLCGLMIAMILLGLGLASFGYWRGNGSA